MQYIEHGEQLAGGGEDLGLRQVVLCKDGTDCVLREPRECREAEVLTTGWCLAEELVQKKFTH